MRPVPLFFGLSGAEQPRRDTQYQQGETGIQGVGQQLSHLDIAHSPQGQGGNHSQNGEKLCPLAPALRPLEGRCEVGLVLLHPLGRLIGGKTLEVGILGGNLGLDIGLVGLLQGLLPPADLLIQHLQVLKLPLGLLEPLRVGNGAVLGLLGGEGVQLILSFPEFLPRLGAAAVQVSPGKALVDGPLPLQLAEGLLQSGAAGFQGGNLPGGLLHLGESLLHLLQLLGEPGNETHALVHPTAVEPLFEPPLRLGVGHVLLPRGHQGGDALFQLRGGGDGEIAPGTDEGRALKDLPAHSGQQIPTGLGGEAGHRFLRAGIDGGEGAEGGVSPGTPAEGDGPPLPLQLHLPLHGGARPGLVVVLVRQMALLVPVPGVDAVEHGPPEGAPGGFAPLVGGLDEV